MKFGSTTNSLAGWDVDRTKLKESRLQRLEAIYRLVEDYNMSVVELNLDLGFIFPQVFDRRYYVAIGDLQQKLGFTCTVHLPTMWLDLSSMNESIRQSSMNCLYKALELTRPLWVTMNVLHLWGFNTVRAIAELGDPQILIDQIRNQAERSLSELGDVIDPRYICVENLEAPDFDLMLPVIEKYGVGVCMDVGHLVWQGGSEMDFLSRYNKRIREVHLHDALTLYNGVLKQTHDHLPLGSGEVNYRGILYELDRNGFEGAVILQMKNRLDLENSLEHIRAYL
jgi:sugar phosphate isomerase/epimerase